MPPDTLVEDHLGIDGEYLDDTGLDASDGPGIVMPGGMDEQELLDLLWKDLHRGEAAKAILTEARMRRVIETSKDLEHRAIEGLGRCAARIPMEMYLEWTAREGPEFWLQEDTLDYFEKRAGGGVGNPGFKITTPGKTMVTVETNFPSGDSGKSCDSCVTAGPVKAGPAKPASRGGRWAS